MKFNRSLFLVALIVCGALVPVGLFLRLHTYSVDLEAASGFFKIYGGDRLLSLNEDYGPIMLKDFDDIQCKGRVVGRLKRK